jgi:hypothetical protein
VTVVLRRWTSLLSTVAVLRGVGSNAALGCGEGPQKMLLRAGVPCSTARASHSPHSMHPGQEQGPAREVMLGQKK